MSYKFDKIDGQDVEHNVAVAFKKWAAAFKKKTGKTLHVTSGRRSVAVQRQGYINYMMGRTGVVKWAKPSESSHCDAGPHGPVAVDVHDSGSDPGVTRKGTARWKAAVETGKAYGFEWGGWGVPDNEGWHFENHKVKPGSYPKPAPKLKDNQRKATALSNRRSTPDTKHAPIHTASKGPLPRGTIGNFVGYVLGEKVEGNNVWLKGISGDYFWSGAWGGPNTKGLKKL